MNSPMRSGPCSPRSCPLMSPRARSGLITKIHLIAARQAPTGDGHRPWSTRRCARVRTLDGCFAFVAYGGPAAFSTRSGVGRYACSSRAAREHLRGRGIEATFAQPRDQHERRRRRGSEGGSLRPSTERPIRFVTRWSGRSTRSSRTGRSRPVMTIGPRSSMTVQVASIRIWLRDPTRSKNSDLPPGWLHRSENLFRLRAGPLRRHRPHRTASHTSNRSVGGVYGAWRQAHRHPSR